MKPETLSEARAWDTRKATLVESGLDHASAARAAWETPDKKPPPDTSENARVLKMLKHDGDAKIAKDLDCYPCGACRKADCFVCEYAKARRKATGFSSKNYGTNNHRKIPELTLRRIETLAKPRQRPCQRAGCINEVHAKRSDARFCSPRCRLSKHRAA